MQNFWNHPDMVPLRAEASRVGKLMDAAKGKEKAALREQHKAALNAIRDRLATLRA